MHRLRPRSPSAPRRLALAFALAAAATPALATDARAEEPHAEEAPRGLWVELPTPADRERARNAGLGWAEGRDGDWYELLGTPAQAEAAGLAWREAALGWETWSPTAAEVAARLDALPTGTVVQLGESVRGAPILGVRFGAGGRAVRVLSGHHGDEGSSVEVALRVAEALAAGEVAPPDGTEVWVVPAVNPDGLDARTRTNANWVDLNRNYGHAWSALEPYGGDGPFSEPETRAIRALSAARSFHAGLSLHSGAQNIGWVWNYTEEERPIDEAWLATLAERYADATAAPDFWTTNGADWYITHGDTTDWSYGAWGTYEYTVELTLQKSPPADEVDTYVAWHLDAVLDWIVRPPDVVAQIVDGSTGEPVPAVVAGEGVRALETGPDGAVGRWLSAPDTPLTVTAPGYAPTALTDETRLTPTALAETLPTPRLLSRGAGPARITIPGAGASPLVLTQPGEASVTVASDGAGWTVDPTALAPGAWTLATDGVVLPRGLFVGEVDDRVVLTGATLDGTVLTLEGSGFAPGAEAWSLGGPARAMRPLTRLSETSTRLVFFLETPDDDVLVWVNGARLAAVDVQGTPTLDLTPPGLDPEPAPVADEEEAIDVVGACATGGAGGSGALLLGVAALLYRRRA